MEINELNNSNNYLFRIIIKNIKIFLIVGIVAVIVSVIFSSPTFIPPEYQSTAIVYPSNLKEFSDESPIEQMNQWFESVEIKNRVIAENKLAEHYEIDKNDKLYYYYMLLTYDENISISETRYESAEIKVVDKDPEMAFKIVNSIIDNFNIVVKEVKLKRTNERIATMKYHFDLLIKQLDSLGYKNNLPFEQGEPYVTHSDRVTSLLAEYAKISDDYHYLLAIADKEISYTNVVVEPYVSQKKVYPIRWLIVLASLFFAEFFTFIVLLFSKKIKQ